MWGWHLEDFSYFLRMTDSQECTDGFCPATRPVAEKDPKDVFFQPITEEKAKSEPNMHEKFIQFCDDNPNDVECRLFDV